MRCCSCNKIFHPAIIRIEKDGETKIEFEKLCSRCGLAAYDVLDTEPQMGDVILDMFTNYSRNSIDN